MNTRLRFAAAVAALATALLACASAAQPPDLTKVEIKTDKVAEGVYMMHGAGGNMAVSVGPDGAFLIDGEMAPLTDKITAAVHALDPHPIRFLLNTHWHSDHTGGNANYAKAGVVILAHENVRARMASDQVHPFTGEKIAASPPEALPKMTFTDSLVFHWNGDEIHVFHFAPAHTDGDAIVCFEKANVIHTGDLYFNGGYPVIDLPAGGSVDGMIAAADRLLGMANDQTKIIPGHGPLSNRVELAAYRDMLAGIRDRVAQEIAAGKSKDGVVAAKPTAAFDDKWGKSFIKPDAFAGVAYESLKKK